MITGIVQVTKFGVQLVASVGVGTLVGWGVRTITPSTATTVDKVVTVGSGLVIAYWAGGKIVEYIDTGFAGLEDWAKAEDENHKAKKAEKKAAKELKKAMEEEEPKWSWKVVH